MEAGKERVKQICEMLRKETLEPARSEAQKILEEARAEAKRIVEGGRKESEALLSKAKAQIAREKEIFDTSVAQAARQALEYLRQQIEKSLFHKGLKELIESKTVQPEVLSSLITAIVSAIEKEGIGTDLSVKIPASVPVDRVNALLAKQILNRLKEKSVLVAPIGGGIVAALTEEHITLDLTAETLIELLTRFIRKDFRHLFFSSSAS